MKCSECGKYLIRLGGIESGKKNYPNTKPRRYEISEYHYIIEDDKRLCEQCFNIWRYGRGFLKNKKIRDLKEQIWKLQEEMKKEA